MALGREALLGDEPRDGINALVHEGEARRRQPLRIKAGAQSFGEGLDIEMQVQMAEFSIGLDPRPERHLRRDIAHVKRRPAPSTAPALVESWTPHVPRRPSSTTNRRASCET